MPKKQKRGGLRLFGAASTKKLMVVALGAIAVFGLAGPASAQQAGYIRISSSKGMLDGSSKDPAYKGWSAIQNAVDVPTPQEVARESSAPSVSEVVMTREPASTQVPGKVVTPRDAQRTNGCAAIGSDAARSSHGTGIREAHAQAHHDN